jgi:hypothetical protein
MPRSLASLLAVLLMTLPAAHAQTTSSPPRFGAAFNGLVSLPDDGLGIGIRGRASLPLNADLSLALDLGGSGFILRGSRDATYVFEPQLSLIINLPNSRFTNDRRFMYGLAGVGAYVPTGDEQAKGGPTIHGGIGWVVPLNETSMFYELDPALVIAPDRVGLAIPFRVGLIF